MKKTPKIMLFLLFIFGILLALFLFILTNTQQSEVIIPVFVEDNTEEITTEQKDELTEEEKELEWQKKVTEQEYQEIYERYLTVYETLTEEEKKEYKDFADYFEQAYKTEGLDDYRLRNLWSQLPATEKEKYKDFEDFKNSSTTLKDVMPNNIWQELNKVHIVGNDYSAQRDYSIASVYSYKSKTSPIYSDYVIFDGDNCHQLYGFFVSLEDYENYPVLVSSSGSTYNYKQENERSFSVNMYGLGIRKEEVKNYLGVSEGEKIAENIEKYYINSSIYYIVDTPNGAFVVYTKDKGSYYDDFVCNRLKIAI